MLETRTWLGLSACAIGRALVSNGFGHLTTLEANPEAHAVALMNIERYGLRGVVTPLLVADMDFDPDGVYEMAVFDSASSTPLDGFERFAPSLADRAIIVFHNTGDANGDVAKGIESLISSGQIEGIHLSTPRGIFVGSLKALNKNDHS